VEKTVRLSVKAKKVVIVSAMAMVVLVKAQLAVSSGRQLIVKDDSIQKLLKRRSESLPKEKSIRFKCSRLTGFVKISRAFFFFIINFHTKNPNRFPTSISY